MDALPTVATSSDELGGTPARNTTRVDALGAFGIGIVPAAVFRPDLGEVGADAS